MNKALAVLLLVWLATIWGALETSGAGAQRPRTEPQVQLVQSVGCVERIGPEPTWWLSSAVEPSEARPGLFNESEISDIADEMVLGSQRFQLIGVADFLDVEGLLASAQRELFTTPEQANATGELRPGRTVVVKGLLIEGDEVRLINLMAVVGLSDTCG
ncbi:MAG: hypothetical protein CL484_14840 [Acidobacteria bacterium]|nr:hypothetical protein [Acidobacteriota bacterium]